VTAAATAPTFQRDREFALSSAVAPNTADVSVQPTPL
jgi:hypothetical protein